MQVGLQDQIKLRRYHREIQVLIGYTNILPMVIKMVTIQRFLAVEVAKRWELHQIDIHNTFENCIR